MAQFERGTLAIHRGVHCDECMRGEITGWRYRCGDCVYNLCQYCIQSSHHDQRHRFILMRREAECVLPRDPILGPVMPLGDRKRHLEQKPGDLWPVFGV